MLRGKPLPNHFWGNHAVTPPQTIDSECGLVYVDVNGLKKPNTVGKDIYALEVLADGRTISIGTHGDGYDANSGMDCTAPGLGYNCSTTYLLQ